MEGDPMLRNLQNQYWENGYTTKSHLYVQCNNYENFKEILHRHTKVNPEVHMAAQKTSNSITTTEQKEQYLFTNYTTEPL
jgi:hypothetical protein